MDESEINKLKNPIIKGERPIYFFVSKDKLTNLKKNSFLGDVCFALFSALLGWGLTSDTITIIFVSIVPLILSFYFYWEKTSIIKKTERSGKVSSFEADVEDTKNASLEIIKASYGTHPGKVVDVTKKLRSEIVNNSLSLKVSNELVDGNDPDKGIVKVLKVEYGIGGQRIEKTFEEHTELKIP
jgi:hypothetical protein